jgi:hypothetical protein
MAADECTLHPARLRAAGARIRAAADAGAALIFVSRFGRAEARGDGFAPALMNIAHHPGPVLTAIRRAHIDAWLACNHGMGTLLDARLGVLESWWREISAVGERIVARRRLETGPSVSPHRLHLLA